MAGDDSWKAKVDEDMAKVPGMTLPEQLAFLSGYTARVFGDEITRGDLHPAQIHYYADWVLARVWREHDEERNA